jgi:hypothetical protein
MNVPMYVSDWYVCLCMYVCMRVRAAYAYACMYVCVSICMHMHCMYVCVCMHAYALYVCVRAHACGCVMETFASIHDMHLETMGTKLD